MASQSPDTQAPRGFVAELRDAVSLRAAILVTATLLLQLGFILSYVGALHHPVPHKAAIGVIAPASQQATIVGQINAIPGQPLDARAVSSEADAIRQIKDRTIYGAFIPGLTGTQDRLLVASASSASLASAIGQTMTKVDATQDRTVAVQDIVPASSNDQNGLSSFYLAIGWCVGGYLVASILGISAGARPANARRATVRLAALALYSVAAGIGGAIIVGPVLGALPASMLALWGIGTLLVFAVGAVSMALQSFLGIVGIGVAVLIFVILGNPSAGGVYAPPMMPPFWRAVGPWLPNGAGTSLNRAYAYFGGANTVSPWLVLVGWAVVGVALTLLGSRIFKRPDTETATPLV